MDNVTKKHPLILPQESYEIMGILYEIQNELGTKYQEKHFHWAFEGKLIKYRKPYKKNVLVKLKYDGINLGKFYLDFVVGKSLKDFIIVEFKTTNHLHLDHARQVLRYLKETNIKLAILVNMRVKPLEYKRIVNPDIDKIKY